MELPRFRDEREFCEKWISPFLSELGYMMVIYMHGEVKTTGAATGMMVHPCREDQGQPSVGTHFCIW